MIKKIYKQIKETLTKNENDDIKEMFKSTKKEYLKKETKQTTLEQELIMLNNFNNIFSDEDLKDLIKDGSVSKEAVTIHQKNKNI